MYLTILNLRTDGLTDGRHWRPGTAYLPKTPQRGFMRSVEVFAHEPGIILYTDLVITRSEEASIYAAASIIAAKAVAVQMASLVTTLANAVQNSRAGVP
jgi:hypothetical protein